MPLVRRNSARRRPERLAPLPPCLWHRPQLAATLLHPASGRGLDILTTAPALVLFTGESAVRRPQLLLLPVGPCKAGSGGAGRLT